MMQTRERFITYYCIPVSHTKNIMNTPNLKQESIQVRNTLLKMREASAGASCKVSPSTPSPRRRGSPNSSITDFTITDHQVSCSSKNSFEPNAQEDDDENDITYKSDSLEATARIMTRAADMLLACCMVDHVDIHAELQETKNPLLAKALEELDNSLMQGGQERITEAWNSLGLVRLHTQRNPREAIRCHENALRLLQSSFSSLSHGQNEENRDPPNGKNGASSSSSSSLLELATTSSLELATTFHDMGLCYERLNESDQALESYQKAKEILFSDEQELMDAYPQRQSLIRSIERLQRIL